MMMRMLEAGGIAPLTDRARVADVDNPKGYYEFEAAKRVREDASWVPDAVGKAVKMVYVLLRALPPGFTYRVILMRRNLEEVVASQKKMLERLGNEGGGLEDARMVDLFRRELEATEEWARERAGMELLSVDYNALVADVAPAAERVAAFLGGGLDTAAMAAVVDPTLYRQRRG